MNKITLDFLGQTGSLSGTDLSQHTKKVEEINSDLNNPNGKYQGYTGWVDLPSRISTDLLADIEKTTNELRRKIDKLVVIGIGGSYLGAKAIISGLSCNFDSSNVIFAGVNLSEEYLLELIEFLEDKSFGICVISKSGTTTEPAIAFRVLKEILIKKVGEAEAYKRIIAITDKEKGALRAMSKKLNFKTFEIPDNIGGRFSVLTPVGLVPVAFAGFDIKELIAGAKVMQANSADNIPYNENLAAQYALTRYGYANLQQLVEIMINYNPKLHYLAEWWKQLFGESEGKTSNVTFPTSLDFTTDLHSMGQYIQEGPEIIFETILNVNKKYNKIVIKEDPDNLDNLNYLAGKSLEYINQKAMEGTIKAHTDRHINNIIINIDELNENTFGQLIYFFEKACGISASLLGVHPFTQPGVEAYKSNMFELLGKNK